MRKILVGVSGASGMPLTLRLLRHLALMPGVELHCVISEGARAVLKAECGLAPERLAGLARTCHAPDDLAAGPASGSWWRATGDAAMLVVPCSMGTLGALASGATRTLLHRAADVALKEGLPLVLVTRESPLSAIHLKNMLRLREAGAVIMPFSPGFYLKPSGLTAMLDQFCGRILDQIGLAHNLGRWSPGTDGPDTFRATPRDTACDTACAPCDHDEQRRPPSPSAPPPHPGTPPQRRQHHERHHLVRPFRLHHRGPRRPRGH